MSTDVSVLGLGAMGRALAGAFAADGRSVTVWNRTPGREGGLDVTVADDVTQALQASPVTVVCVVDAEAVRECLSTAASLEGSSLVNLGNGTPREARELARWCRDRGARYLDGAIMAVPPIVGTPAARILLSGDEQVAGEHRTLLEGLGTVEVLGADDGLAAVWDLALLTGMYGLFAGFLQAAALATGEGITAEQLRPRFEQWVTAMTPSLTTMAEQIDARRYDEDVASPLAMQAESLSGLVAAARDAGLRTDLVDGLERVVAQTVASGHGDHSTAAVVETLRRG